MRRHGEKSEIHGVLLHSVRAGLLPAAVRCRRDLRLDGHSLPPNRFRRKMRTAPPTPRTSVPAQARLDRLHVVVREAEMVADLVDQDMAHDMLQILAGVAPVD